MGGCQNYDPYNGQGNALTRAAGIPNGSDLSTWNLKHHRVGPLGFESLSRWTLANTSAERVTKIILRTI